LYRFNTSTTPFIPIKFPNVPRIQDYHDGFYLDIIVSADDDAIRHLSLFPDIFAFFHILRGSKSWAALSQRVRPCWGPCSTTRNTEIASSTHIDGGIPCLSRPTTACRTVILNTRRLLTDSLVTTSWANIDCTPQGLGAMYGYPSFGSVMG
jgi:hypothetical protein